MKSFQMYLLKYFFPLRSKLVLSLGNKGFWSPETVDHLKEINDRFGHAEGDFAIKSVAGFIRDAVGKEQILGRLGGDEFVAIVVLKDGETPEQICDKIRASAEAFNAHSDKPFYIECSLGYNAFTCEADIDMQDVLDAADRELYKNKKNRRLSSVR